MARRGSRHHSAPPLATHRPVLPVEVVDRLRVGVCTDQGPPGCDRRGGDADVEIRDRSASVEELGLQAAEVLAAEAVERKDVELTEEGDETLPVGLVTGGLRGGTPSGRCGRS